MFFNIHFYTINVLNIVLIVTTLYNEIIWYLELVSADSQDNKDITMIYCRDMLMEGWVIIYQQWIMRQSQYLHLLVRVIYVQQTAQQTLYMCTLLTQVCSALWRMCTECHVPCSHHILKSLVICANRALMMLWNIYRITVSVIKLQV